MFRLAKPFRPGVARLRHQFQDRARVLFDLLCMAGQLGYYLPDDDVNVRYALGRRDPRRSLVREFARVPEGNESEWRKASDRVVEILVSELAGKEICKESQAVRVLMGQASRALAPDCVVPQHRLLLRAWRVLIKVFGNLFPAGVRVIGQLECVRQRLPGLRREMATGLKIGRLASGRRPGRRGCEVAVAPQLINSVSRALRKKLMPAYWARSLFYARPGDHIWPHPDDPKFDVTVLVCIRHEVPRKVSRRSAFVAYMRNGAVRRYQLAPGDVLAIEPGLLHGREPVKEGERVALLSIGLFRAPRGTSL